MLYLLSNFPVLPSLSCPPPSSPYPHIFPYSSAALLGWSPCTRAMMKRKRKSNSLVLSLIHISSPRDR
ncbi:hypothetical protein, partial [Sphingobacterium daejeonense]|uniref:hypothetical protein n=1 Tax=Sphingobacterium daejeonense TaxID=371142 RepID=UPI003D322564